MRKSLLVIGLAAFGLAATAMTPTSLEGQRQRNQNLKKLLIVNPIPESPGDSTIAVQFGDQFRDRASGKLRNRMRVFDTETYCEALMASGFPCDTRLDANAAEQLASFMTADAYVTSVISNSGSVPTITVRLVDSRRSGLAGLFEAQGEGDGDVRNFADITADSVRNQYRAAEDVQDCSERRDRGDIDGARERAQRALDRYPNHPSAALCISYLFEATQQPVDSLIWAYNKVVAGDPADTRGWERLGRLYFQQGDTVSAITAFGGQLDAEPTNHNLRIQNSQMWAEIDSLDRALSILEGGVEYDSERFLQIQASTCVAAEAWGCVLDINERRYDADNSLGQDEDFLRAVIGAADLGADTSAAVRWTGMAARSFPDNVGYLQTHAAWVQGSGDADSALAIFRSLAASDPSNTTALLAIVSAMQDQYVIDSMTPVDTTALNAMDSLLTLATQAAAGDQQTLQGIGSLYLRPGIGYAQLRIHQRLAADWLAKSLEYPLPQQVVPQANFFLGFMTVFYLTDVFAEVQAAETCEAVDAYETHVMRGKNALTTGASIAPGAANQLLSEQYPRFEQVIPQFREAWSCTVPEENR